MLGLLNDKEHRVRLLIDRDVMNGEYVGCHPCINTSSIRFKTEDFRDKIIPALGYTPTYVVL